MSAEMKARMKTDLVKRYKQIFPKEYDEEIGAFLEHIEGKEVDLVFIGNDAFEKEDNDIWLPQELWDPV